ncbi:hypothetical protein KP509_04G077900 [Ceratopteris richardii]|uniref:Epidermal patterning factor-like protein n=1 Tax=Ceratopteris richardii TaxID=49495 RepID=A0A8T2V6D7_CERRI|nr:hypothetical protein KP509_04G077900 [Ceratopteris richardii]
MMIGSSPPICVTKCRGCNPCIAIQVPTNPRTNSFIDSRSWSGSMTSDLHGGTMETRLQSSYKPEDWKCTCGNKIFNP